MFNFASYLIGPLYRCFSKKRMHAVRSPLLYSYGMHHPRGPNFRRSCTYGRIFEEGGHGYKKSASLTKKKNAGTTVNVP